MGWDQQRATEKVMFGAVWLLVTGNRGSKHFHFSMRTFPTVIRMQELLMCACSLFSFWLPLFTVAFLWAPSVSLLIGCFHLMGLSHSTPIGTGYVRNLNSLFSGFDVNQDWNPGLQKGSNVWTYRWACAHLGNPIVHSGTHDVLILNTGAYLWGGFPLWNEYYSVIEAYRCVIIHPRCIEITLKSISPR